MSSAARVGTSATRRSFWHLVGVGFLCLGTTCGGGALLYRRRVLATDHHRALQRLPARCTQQYMSGSGGNRAVVHIGELQHRLPLLLLYGFVIVRMLLLVTHVVPVLWYAFLTYALHLCEERVLFEKLCAALTAMGPSYIKLGQWMATRPDFFPPVFCASLEKLYDDTTPHSWSHTEKILRNTFCEAAPCDVRLMQEDAAGAKVTAGGGAPPMLEEHEQQVTETGSLMVREGRGRKHKQEEKKKEKRQQQQPHRNALYYLQEVETVPVNSGSIAQVHRGVLREEVDGIRAGTEVAIKVTHPYIRELIAADIAAMWWFVKILTLFVPSTAYFDMECGLYEFSCLLRSQLNLRVECDNLLQFTYNFREFPGVIFPQPLPSLSTEDVLVETFESGQPLQEVQSVENYRDVAERGCHMFLKMLFEDNFVHSDLHPGNILLRTNPGAPQCALSASKSAAANRYPDGKVKLRHELVVLDAGLTTTLSKKERNNFIALFAAVACGDGKLGADLMLDRMPDSRGGRRDVNREKFRADMSEIFSLVAPGTTDGFKLSSIRIGPVLGKIMNTLRENKAPIDGNFASLVLTVVVGEGLGRRLTPDFNIFAEAAPYLVALLEDRELYFLASKLRETYGTTALLRDSLQFVRLERTATYAEMAAKKVAKTVDRVCRLLAGGSSDELVGG